MCIFFISRFQTTFSHEMTAVSEIYCQNLKDKTSILCLVGQIIKMTKYFFFSSNGELSYKLNKYF